MKRILILGGTKFVGRICAEAAVTRGYHVTLFNRGLHASPPPVPCSKSQSQTESQTPDETSPTDARGSIQTIIGDRLAPDGLSALAGLSFDTVIDTWAGDPAAVKTALRVLSARIHHYVYISSVSVYRADDITSTICEETELWAANEAPNAYIANKIGGEINAVRSGVPTALIRAGVILGPHEDVGRLPHWLRRMSRGGAVLAPGPREMGLQFVDARDLVSFVLDAVETTLNGAYNVASEKGRANFGDLLDTVNEVTGNRAQLRWLESDKLLAEGVQPWTELPLWLPPGRRNVYNSNVSKAMSKGFRARPFRETIADTWAWLQQTDAQPKEAVGRPTVGLDPDKERAILEKYFRGTS